MKLRLVLSATMIFALATMTGCAASSDPEQDQEQDQQQQPSDKEGEAQRAPTIEENGVEPARKRCRIVSAETFEVITGVKSEYGGMYCH